MKAMFSMLAAFGLIGTLTAGVIVKHDAEKGKNDISGVTGLAQDAQKGKAAYEVKKGRTIISKKRFKVSPDKYYVVTAWVKTAGEEPSYGYLGFAPYTAKGRFISQQSIYGLPGTLTELAAPCKKTDKVIKIKNGAKWQKNRWALIAFGAKADNSDLPNFNHSSIGIEKIEKKGDIYEVTLVKAVGRAYPAGTKVREHRCGGSYMYAKHGKVPTKWTKWEGKPFKGNQFRKGTAAAQAIMICNYSKNGKKTMLVDEIVVEELDAPKKK
jgi:hypothetical protein